MNTLSKPAHFHNGMEALAQWAADAVEKFNHERPWIRRRRTPSTEMKTTKPEPFPAFVLFAPCEGCVNAETCKSIGCIAKELEETI